MTPLLAIAVLLIVFGVLSEEGWPAIMLGVGLLMVAFVIFFNGVLT